ncbi:MAG: hypothetical protein ACFFDT_13590 [Candidatus Hodarchaeota archaeon]
MSFTDISHVILAQRHQIEKIVSFDDHLIGFYQDYTETYNY